VVWSQGRGGHQDHQEHLYRELAAQQSSYYLVDLKLTCRTGENLYCHRLVLARHSQFLRLLLQSTDTEDSGLAVLILPDFSLSELETMLDLVYRREASQADRRMVNKLEDCLRLRDIDKENVCLFSYFEPQT